MSRRGLLRAAGASLVAASGCTPARPAVDEVVFALGGNPTNLDPRFAQDAFSDRITRLVFSTLLEGDGRGGAGPHLALAVERPDATTRICRLRPDARFHDGTSVVARDVVATYRSILDPAVGSVRRLALDPIATVDVLDPHTVRFVLKRPHAPFDSILCGIAVAPARSLEEHGPDFRDHLVGSGAFRLVEQRPDAHVLLEASSTWFGGTAACRRLRFRIVPDATVRTLEVMHGTADLTQNDLPPHVIERLRREEDLEVDTSPSTLVKYLAYNLRHPYLRDVRVRRAIAVAIDREPILRHKLRGTATPASSFLHPDHWAYEPDSRVYPHDPALARRLLDEAGLPPGDRRLELVYRTSTDATSIAVARILKRQLERVGIRMELRTNEWGVFFSDIKQGLYDLYTLTAVGVSDPDWYAYVFDSRRMPPDGANRTFYENPEVDALIDAGRAAADRAERAAIYRRLQRITADEIPLLPLWSTHNTVVRGRNVSGYAARPDGDFAALVHTRKDGPR